MTQHRLRRAASTMASTGCGSSARSVTVRATRPRERRSSVSTRVPRAARPSPSAAGIGATRRARPVTDAIPASSSHGSYPASSSQSESTPAASSARASARYSPASSNRRGSRTPILSMARTVMAAPRALRHLGPEDHDDAEGQAADQHEAGGEHRRSSTVGGTKQGQWYQRAREHERPEDEPACLQEGRPDRPEADEEDEQQQELEHDEVSVRAVELGLGGRRRRRHPRQQSQRGGGDAEPGGQEQPAERPRVAPDGLVADAEQHAGIAGQEHSEERADDDEQPAERAAEEPEAFLADDGFQERHEREGAEDQQHPHADRHRRPVLEVEAERPAVDQHVPEAERTAEIEREQDGTDR